MRITTELLDSTYGQLGAVTAYPEVIVVFRVLDQLHAFQVQVNLSPYSYSTYFGTVGKL
jgi:5-hydroxyisourate hydrolase